MISVGIDIGRASVKVVEAELAARSFVLKRFLDYPLSMDPNKDQKIEVIDILRNLIPQYNPESTRFVFSVRQEDVSLRLKHFPFRERHKILRAVPFEVEDEIPFSLMDSIFEAKILRFEGKMAEVLTMACPKDRIKNAIQLAHDGGVHPSILSLETVALGNFFESWNEPPREAAPPLVGIELQEPVLKSGDLLIDIGHLTTKCMFFEDGALVAVRQVDWGGRNVINQVAQKYGLSFVLATKEVQAKAFIATDKSTATKEQIAFSKVIETSVLDLIRELRLKILEVHADHQLNIAKAHMLGGPTLMRGLGGFLTQHLEIAFNRFKFLSLSPNVTFEADATTEAIAGVAVGLAIEGLKRPRNPAVNFLKDEFASQSQTFERFWGRWKVAAQIGVACFIALIVWAFIRDSMSTSMVDASEEALKTQAAATANLKGSAASPSKIKKFLAEHEKMEKARKQAEKVLKLNSALDVLSAVSSAIPERVVVEIKRFNVDNDVAEIHGLLGVGTRVGELQQALQSASQDGKVEVISPQFSAQGGKQPFAFRFHVNRMDGG